MAPPLTEELSADEPGMVGVTIDVDERLALPVEARKGRVRLRMKLPREACPGALGAPPRKLYLFRSWFSYDCGGGYLEEVLAPDLATAAREALASIDTDETTSAAVLEVVGMMELDVAGEQRRRVVAKRAAKQAATEAAERAQYEALRAKYEGREARAGELTEGAPEARDPLPFAVHIGGPGPDPQRAICGARVSLSALATRPGDVDCAACRDAMMRGAPVLVVACLQEPR